MNHEGNILVLTQWSFKDALVQTYTLPYVDFIRKLISTDRKILLLTAEQQPVALDKKEIRKINNEWNQKNLHLVSQPYRHFGWKKMVVAGKNLFNLYRLIRKENIKTIHAFCTPAGGIAYLLSKMTGAKLIIDSYEPHAEAMVENGTWKRNGLAFRILFSLEKKQTRRATALIATTAGMKQYALEKYGIEVKTFFVKPACVDLQKFSFSVKDPLLLEELQFENKIVCVYAGKLGGIYLREEVFDFIRACYDHWKEEFRFLMLSNSPKEEIAKEMQRVQLPAHIVVSRFILHKDVPLYLSLGDFAINPVKPVPTKRYCTSIKDGEYWAMGLPVVISPNISDDSDIIQNENTGIVMDYTDKKQYSPAIKKLEQLMKAKPELTKKIRDTGIKYRSYNIAENIYKELYG